MDKVIRYCKEHQLIAYKDALIVGVSGGADSMGLLYFLLEIQKEYSLKIHCVHINHGLRGEESKKDAAFVEAFCKEKGISLTIREYDVMAIARKRHKGMEEVARWVRYQSFVEIGNAIFKDGYKICVAHHKNDQGETILLHLLRGSSYNGLQGMRARNNNIIRPFLGVEHQEIIDYLKKNHIPWREDKSNQDITYRRNYIRHQLLPMCKDINQDSLSHIVQVGEDHREWLEWFYKSIEPILDKSQKTGGLSIQVLGTYPKVVACEVIRGWLKEIGVSLENILRKDLESIYQLKDKPVGKKVSLSPGKWILRNGNKLCLWEEKEDIPIEYRLELGQKIEFGGYEIFAQEKIFQNKEKEECIFYFPYDMINKSLIIRHPRRKDWIQVYPDGKSQSMMKFYKNQKVSSDLRKEEWVLALEDEILIAFEHRRCAHYYVEHGNRCIQIQVRKRKENERRI